MKRLYRSHTDRMLAGVMGGLGAYFRLDATLLRLAYVFATVFTGFIPGVVAYVLAVLIVPLGPTAGPYATVDDIGAV